jgi:hypothetical protein
VCLDPLGPDAFWLNCGHGFCSRCLLGWVAAKVIEREVNLKCFVRAPDAARDLPCGKVISATEMALILDPSPELLLKYTRFKAAIADPGMRECPACGTPHSGAGPGLPDIVCAGCGRSFCWAHGEAHAGTNCAEFSRGQQGVAAAAEDAAIAASSKPCPRCAAPSMKVEGCNHIACPHCHASWCWVCGAEVDSSQLPLHYQFWNLRGCANSQFSDNASTTWQQGLSVLYAIIVGLPSFALTGIVYLACCCVCVPASLAYEQGALAFFLTMCSVVATGGTATVVGLLAAPFLLVWCVLIAIQRTGQAVVAFARGKSTAAAPPPTPLAARGAASQARGASLSGNGGGTGDASAAAALAQAYEEGLGEPDSPAVVRLSTRGWVPRRLSAALPRGAAGPSAADGVAGSTKERAPSRRSSRPSSRRHSRGREVASEERAQVAAPQLDPDDVIVDVDNA